MVCALKAIERIVQKAEAKLKPGLQHVAAEMIIDDEGYVVMQIN